MIDFGVQNLKYFLVLLLELTFIMVQIRVILKWRPDLMVPKVIGITSSTTFYAKKSLVFRLLEVKFLLEVRFLTLMGVQELMNKF